MRQEAHLLLLKYTHNDYLIDKMNMIKIYGE